MELKNIAINIENLSFSYKDKQVLKNLQVSFEKDKFSVLLGVNGGGKSTLFKLIAGIMKKYEGSISVLGANMSDLTYKQRAKNMGFLPQFNQSVFSFTVEEILLTGRMAFSGYNISESDKQMTEKVMKEMSIQHLSGKHYNLLSGGEQQIVMISRLLMQHPNILLLDEPTNHLDVYYQHFLMDKLKKYSQSGFTVIAIMHNPTLAFQYADNFYYLHKGYIYDSDPTVPDIKLLEEIYNVNFATLINEDDEYILPIGGIL